MTSSPLKKFQSLLRELFQFDCANLDFGIYRIMNHKRDVVEKWITETLPARVEAELRTGALRADSTTADRLEELKGQLTTNFGADALDGDGNLADTFHGTPLGKQYLELRKAAEHAIGGGDQRAIVFNHLYQFFSHYYDSGDFLSLRRYSARQKYAIPYNGEEVHLHWANADQYYIKTSEYFTDYRWKAPGAMGDEGFTVLFKLRNAEQETGNNKANEKRYFVFQTDCSDMSSDCSDMSELSDSPTCRRVESGDMSPHSGHSTLLTIPVQYRALTAEEAKAFTGNGDKPQQMLCEAALAGVRAHALVANNASLKAAILAPARNSAGQAMVDSQKEPVPLLLKHLRTYARRNNSDFFIHKDLSGFLTRELDFYLKNEVLSLDTLLAGGPRPSEGWFQLLHVIKTLGNDIIAFLAQLENFQKTLFEKKKFVTDCHWCLTLDRVSASLLPEIAANPRQWDQWEDLHKIFTIEPKAKTWAKGKGPEKALAWLKSMPFLMADTSLFKDSDFQDRLLATLPDIEGQMDGLLVNSENFQGLRLMEEMYRECVQCVYIDPPYNTGGDSFIYKDSYQHSSWGSFLFDRASTGAVLLDPKLGSWFTSIDDGEQAFLRMVMGQALGDENFVGNIIWQKKYAPANDAKWLSDDHDFIFAFACNKAAWSPGRIGRDEKQDKAYSNPDNDTRGDWKAGDYKCNKNADERPNLYYPIKNPKTGKDVWPQRNRVWAYSKEQHARNVAENLIWWGKDGTNEVPAYKRFLSNVGDLVPRTIWKHDEVGHNQDGIRQLRALLPDTSFTSPKPCGLIERAVTVGSAELVLDFFAGSGTTGHAVINLNREDGGTRKYILMEMGTYFDELLKKRIQKVAFSKDWKDGSPVAQKKPLMFNNPYHGISQAFKVIRLESYEDALANIEFCHQSEGELFTKQVGAEYLLKYALEFETQGSATRLCPEALTAPFDYQLNLFDGTDRGWYNGPGTLLDAQPLDSEFRRLLFA